MGQRVNPIVFRLKKSNDWLSQWYTSTKENYGILANQDVQIRSFLDGLFIKEDLLVGEVRIVRSSVRREVMVEIELLGKKKLADSKYDTLLKKAKVGLTNFFDGIPGNIILSCWLSVLTESNIKMSATLLSRFLVVSLETHKNIRFVERDLKFLLPRISASKKRGRWWKYNPDFLSYLNDKGLRGIRIEFRGRFTKKGRRAKKRVVQYGVVPTQSIRSSVDYSSTYAVTRYGCVGIKVWLHKD